MPHFFIIDTCHNLLLAEGSDKASAVDKHNDANAIKADVIIEAIPCIHYKKFVAPELPDWMEVNVLAGSQVCYKCAGETQKDAVIAEDDFFVHTDILFI